MRLCLVEQDCVPAVDRNLRLLGVRPLPHDTLDGVEKRLESLAGKR